MGTLQDARQRLIAAWKHRINMDMDACCHIHDQLRDRLVRSPANDREWLRLVAEWRLLGASLLRAEGRWEESRKAIREIDAWLRERSLPAPFQLRFQQGLMHFNDGDATSALDCFLGARSLATSVFEEVIAIGNALLCLENLGRSLDPHFAAFEQALARAPRDPDLLEARRTRDALLCRRRFRAGDFRGALEIAPGDPISQAYYYQLWLSELPFVSRSLPERWDALLTAHPLAHQKAYRTRTLLGLLNENDLPALKLTELADRIYLWTWRWLADPERQPIERVLALLAAEDEAKLAGRLTAEDYAMIRNALGWLVVFDPSAEKRCRRFLLRLRPAHPAAIPFLEWELALIEHWRTNRKGLLPRAPRGFSLPASLQKELRALARGEQKGAKLIVDISRDCLRPRRGEPIVSAPLCAALELLHEKESVPVAELALACFGIRRYDELVHLPRVANLLTRLRKVVPRDLQLAIRAGRVHALGGWRGIAFATPPRHTRALLAEPQWQAWLRGRAITGERPRDTRRVTAGHVLQSLPAGASLRREDLEKLTGKSRTTTKRLIADWIKNGILKKNGQARGTRYVLAGSGGN